MVSARVACLVGRAPHAQRCTAWLSVRAIHDQDPPAREPPLPPPPQVAALLIVLGIGWVLYLYNGLSASEEKTDLHLHVVDEGSEAGIRQRLAMLERRVQDLSRSTLQQDDEGEEGGGGAGAGSAGGRGGPSRQPGQAGHQRYVHQRITDRGGLGLVKDGVLTLGDGSGLRERRGGSGDAVEENLHHVRLNLLAEQRKRRSAKDIPLEPRQPLAPAPVMPDDEVARCVCACSLAA